MSASSAMMAAAKALFPKDSTIPLELKPMLGTLKDLWLLRGRMNRCWLSWNKLKRLIGSLILMLLRMIGIILHLLPNYLMAAKSNGFYWHPHLRPLGKESGRDLKWPSMSTRSVSNISTSFTNKWLTSMVSL